LLVEQATEQAISSWSLWKEKALEQCQVIVLGQKKFPAAAGLLLVEQAIS
jgi:hypothetical protein